jgi:hypothetical protein
MTYIAFSLRSLLLYTFTEEKANADLRENSNRIDKRFLFLYQGRRRDLCSKEGIEISHAMRISI